MSFSSYQIFIGTIYSFKCFLSKLVGWEDIFEPFFLLNLLNIVYCDLLRISFFLQYNKFFNPREKRQFNSFEIFR